MPANIDCKYQIGSQSQDNIAFNTFEGRRSFGKWVEKEEGYFTALIREEARQLLKTSEEVEVKAPYVSSSTSHLQSMTDTLVSFALGNLNSFLQEELRLVTGVTDQVKKLSSTFSAIQAVLEDAEEKQTKEKVVRDWLGKLKDVAYDVDDILDDWRTQILRSQIRETNGGKKVKTYLMSPYFGFNSLVLRHKFGQKIKEIGERLDEIAEEKNKYHFSEERRLELGERLTSSLVDESEIFGRSEDTSSILGKLVNEGSQEEVGFPVISIVGMGGIGKTTLAQLAFNHEMVKTHFEKRMWVCACDDFDVTRLTKAMIEATDEKRADGAERTLEGVEFDTLQRCLMDILNRKRFLLILDDVWNEEVTKWDKLRLPLKGAAQGSRILVTTRSEKVAMAMGTTHWHGLKALSEDDCWSLFSCRAFVGRSREEILELEKIGKEIVKKCKGVPLTAKTVGSAMRFKRKKQDWQLVLNSATWDLHDVDKGILSALLLSYYNLPLHLKQCFAYCSIYPKGWEIRKDILIRLWIAQGFLSSEGRKDVEEKGGEYFDDLVTRSLLQDVVKDEFGTITRCKMHDLVHDLAQFVANGECCIIEFGKVDLNYFQGRHASLVIDYDVKTIPVSLYDASNLRTLLHLGWSRIETIPSDLFHHLTCLRALDLSKTNIQTLPTSVRKLKHLRYLDLSNTEIEELPESISKLCNLQTLKLNSCYKLYKLPSRMKNLINLKHLEIKGSNDLFYLPKGIGTLTSLHTLSKFIVGGNSEGCNIEELKDLNLLQGELVIENLERVMSESEGRKAQIDNKKDLWALHLCCADNESAISISETEKMKNVFETLRPNNNLNELQIINYLGTCFPSWIEDSSFINLVDVSLEKCKQCTQLPTLGKLPFLKYLQMWEMDQVKSIGSEFYQDGAGVSRAFPKLEKLSFYIMNSLEEWELRVEDGHMPSLLGLTIRNCPKLKGLPKLPNMLEEFDMSCCVELASIPLPMHLKRLILGDSLGMLLRPLPHLPELKHLEVRDTLLLNSITDGLVQLRSLETLEIVNCPQLSYLPEDLQHLTALKELKIYQCPVLTDRCKKEAGEDWQKIAHIPNIEIDWEKIQ